MSDRPLAGGLPDVLHLVALEWHAVCEDGQLSADVRAVLTWIVEVDMRSGGQMEVRIIFGFSCETVEQQTVDQTAIHKAGFDIWLLRQEQ